MELWANLYKWVVELAGETKLAIAILLALVIFFGYTTFNISNKHDALMEKYTLQVDKNGETTKQLDNQCNARVDTINARWEKKHELYRARVDEDTRALVQEIKKKNDALETAKDQLEAKLYSTQTTANNISNKLK